MAPISTTAVTVSDAVSKLRGLVDEHGGRLLGSKVKPLCAENANLKQCLQAIKDTGGLKKLCDAHEGLEFVIPTMGDGYVKRLSDPVGPKHVVSAMLKLVDENNGKLCGAQMALLYQKQPEFKQIVEAAGGLKKFCMTHDQLSFQCDDGAGCIRRRSPDAGPVPVLQGPGATVSRLDVLGAVAGLIDREGGKLVGQKFTAVYEQNKNFKPIVQKAGGPKAFCECCTELTVTTAAAGVWFVQKPTARNTRTTLLAKNIRWTQDTIKLRFRNGKLLAGTLQKLLRKPSSVEKLPVLEVVQKGDNFYAVNGNRRLWVLKELSEIQERNGRRPLSVNVKVRDEKWASQSWVKERFSTDCDGKQVSIVVKHHLKHKERFPTMALAMAAEMLRGSKAKAPRCSGSDADETESTTDGDLGSSDA